jgi:uncharacterized membrane protein
MDISTAFSNAYSGWILWNLFLAFVPVVLSFWLFRPKAIPREGLLAILVTVGLIGAIGLWPRVPRVARSLLSSMAAASEGSGVAQLRLLAIAALLLAAVLVGLVLLKNPQMPRGWLWWVGLFVMIAFLPNAPYVLTDIIHLIRGISYGRMPVWVIALVFVPIHLTAIFLGFEAYVLSIVNLGYYLKRQGLKAWILPSELLIHALSAIGIYLGRFLRFNSWDLVIEPTSVLADTLNVLTSRRPAAVIIVTFTVLSVLYWLMKQVTLGLKLRIDYARQGIDALS